MFFPKDRRTSRFSTLRSLFNLKNLLLCVFFAITMFLLLLSEIFSNYHTYRRFEQTTLDSIGDTVSQTKKLMDVYFYNILKEFIAIESERSLQKLIRLSYEEEQEMNLYADLSNQIDQATSSLFDLVDGISIYLEDSRLLIHRSHLSYDPEGFILRELREVPKVSQKDYPRKYLWQLRHPNPIIDNAGVRHNLPMLTKRIQNSSLKYAGLMYFELKKELLERALISPGITPDSRLVLIKGNSWLSGREFPALYRPAPGEIDRLYRDRGPSGRGRIKSGQGKELIVVYEELKTNDWLIAAVVPEETLIRSLKEMNASNYTLVILLILTAMVLINLFLKVITKPINVLSRKVHQVETGDLNVDFDLRGLPEITILNDGIGALIVRIKALLREIEEKKELEKKMELKILQAQIKPHFLYNTLYSIQQLYDLGEYDNGRKMLIAFSHFYRIGLSRGKSVIPLAEEIRHIENYLVIQKIKYERKFDYRITVPPELGACLVLKLTLQPVIENAIYHGINRRSEAGMIAIRAEKEGAGIRITVEDDGPGIPAEKLAGLKKLLAREEDRSGGFGLLNVHKRLQIHFGEAFGLRLSSSPGEGTRVALHFPFRPGGE